MKKVLADLGNCSKLRRELAHPRHRITENSKVTQTNGRETSAASNCLVENRPRSETSWAHHGLHHDDEHEQNHDGSGGWTST